MTSETIQIGDTVRIFDFLRNHDLRGERACYVEGAVTQIVAGSQGTVYVIDVQRDVSSGEVVKPGRPTVTRLVPWHSECNSVVLLSAAL